MIPDRDSFLVKAEMRRRQQEAAEARLVREARRGARDRRAIQAERARQSHGAFAWLRRLAGGTR